MVHWSDPTPTPNKVLGLGMTAVSSYLPGFADAFIEGNVANPLTAQALSGLPSDVAAQAAHFLQPGLGSSGCQVLAPLFRPGADKLVVAANYHYGIQSLTNAGSLNAKSAYVGALLDALAVFLQSGGTAALAIPTVAPSGPVETAIQQAVSLALK